MGFDSILTQGKCRRHSIYVLLTLSSLKYWLLYPVATEEEENLDPYQLSDHLLKQMHIARQANIPIKYQYVVPYQTILREVDRGVLEVPIQPSQLDDMRDRKFTRRWHRS